MISVVVAVRNELPFIEECVVSLFNQSYTGNYEVIIVNGMSDDGTYEKLLELQKKFDFKVLKNPGVNAAAGRNLGIQEAKGDYVAFIDADAIAHHDWLEEIHKTFEQNKKVIGVGGPDLLPEDSTRKSRMIGRVMTSPLARGGRLNPSTQHAMHEEERFVEHIPTCNLCLKKDVFDKVGLFDESFVKGQDLELSYRIIKQGYKLLYSPSIKVVHHRKRDVRSFAWQIFKWAKAKVAIIKKHGMQRWISHVYLWPVYGLVFLCLSFLFFFLFGLIEVFLILFFLGVVSYIAVVCVESGRLMRKFNDKKLFLNSLTLLPVVHMSYAFGVLKAVVSRRIW